MIRPGNRLRELRKAAELTQIELADRTGVSQPTISQLENGVLSMDIAWMRSFARVLGCTPADLLDEQDNPDRLDPEERALLDHYRTADELQREMVQRVAAPTSEYRATPRRSAA